MSKLGQNIVKLNNEVYLLLSDIRKKQKNEYNGSTISYSNAIKQAFREAQECRLQLEKAHNQILTQEKEHREKIEAYEGLFKQLKKENDAYREKYEGGEDCALMIEIKQLARDKIELEKEIKRLKLPIWVRLKEKYL